MSRSTAFGHADLTAHGPGLSGAVQAHGFLLVLREPRLRVVQASMNAGAMLHRPLDTLLLATLRDLGGDLELRLRDVLAAGPPNACRPLRCTIGTGARARRFEGAAHRVGTDTVVLELEPLAAEPGTVADCPSTELLAHLSSAVQRFSVASSVVSLAAAAARCVRDLLGYDRVVVSELGAGGVGRVIAESLDPHLASLVGHNLAMLEPTPQASGIYLRQRVRVLVDVQAVPADLVPQLPPGSDGEFELAQTFLCATTPEHARLLRTQGVAASLVAALVRDGRLWGLISCHHTQPRNVRYGLRAAIELLAEVFTTRLTAIEHYARVQVAAEVRRLEQRMVEATATDGDWRAALFRHQRTLLQPLEATGAVLCHEGELLSCGEVPDGDDLRALLQWLAGLPPSAEPFHCTALGHVSPALSHLGSTARGVLAVRLSPLRGDFLVWLRREHNGSGSALPWAGNDIALAGALGGALVDMILQVNAVRLLIAESQLAQVRATVAGSQEAVVVCDTAQRAFFANAAFHTLAGRRHGELTDLETLAGLFMDPRRAHAVIGQVRAEQRPWHGELALRRPDGSVLPVAMRAEPVPARDRTLLGCILIFDDLSEAKRADAARARLEAVLSQVGRAPQAPDGHDLVGAIIANASLAAMDIAEGGSGPAVAPLLQEVEASTARATALLDCIRQFTGKPGDPQ